jgi:hypothetical protein
VLCVMCWLLRRNPCFRVENQLDFNKRCRNFRFDLKLFT